MWGFTLEKGSIKVICVEKVYTEMYDRTLKVHSKETLYNFDVWKSFTQKFILNEHMGDHTGDKPYNGDVYRKSCTHKFILTEHMRFHSGEVPYNCDVSRKRFAQKFRLTEHMMVHTGERPYKCDLWGNVFHRNVY